MMAALYCLLSFGLLSSLPLAAMAQRPHACAGDTSEEESVTSQLAAAIHTLAKNGSIPGPFMWGTATAAYQIEGAWNTSGKVPSIWDVFTQTSRDRGLNKIKNDDTGDIADDFYNKYPEDIQMMRGLNMTHFRFSISWTRVMNGTTRNEPGIKFYRQLTNSLVLAGIKPVVTLYHWDLPATLDWREEEVVDAFVAFADVMFAELPMVKHWITFNEPWVFCKHGYQAGAHAPGVRSRYGHLQCGHNVLLAHAKTYALWQDKYATKRPQAKVGITLNAVWRLPLDAKNPEDVAMVGREINSQIGWFADPLFDTGDYPESLKEQYGSNMPVLSAEDQAALKGSADFLGLNHYTTNYADSVSNRNTFYRNSVPIGWQSASSWLYAVPWGFRRLLGYIQKRWNPAYILVTENGMSDEDSANLESLLNDQLRLSFYHDYLSEMAKAIYLDGVRVGGYFAWTLMDNFEWSEGFAKRFGITHVDFKDPDRKRTLKESAKFLGALITSVRNEVKYCLTDEATDDQGAAAKA
ncbi:unnamed protein product [Vitrella brassicaformis CCMP3155]|uniref:Beta-glucosidase n=2 Tax=Vitrella brassicaformis TaxID=1169539 RepID=A0A0G4FUP8_VITBC|nr:unnamed protein product [Vitrella brassicaformis CCMP3155]|eukprot:CEM18318.1 unnamed protein product [Vitrella brassicaformis CCMP3155]